MRKALFSFVAVLLLLPLIAPGTISAQSNSSGSNASKVQISGESEQSQSGSDSMKSNSNMNLVQYVDPFIGTGGDANLFPGADVPFGMVQWGPDTNRPSPGGYKYTDRSIKGFSMTHMSGAGCLEYGDIPFMPIVGDVETSPATNPGDYSAGFSHDNEQASPGYYQVKLDSDINTKLTVTQRSGFGEFSYPSGQQATMLINTSGSLTGVSDSTVKIVGNNKVTGSATSGHFCGASNKHTVYFAAKFDHPFKTQGTWNGSKVDTGSETSDGTKSGAYVTFDTSKDQTVKMKVGVSYVSVENAKENLQKENQDWDFTTKKKQASEKWNQLLNQIQVNGGTEKQKEIFYTALYHSLLQPNVFSDANGEYIGFDNKVHKTKKHTQYTNFSGWDAYRSKFQLISLVAPEQTSDMVQSLINDAKQGGQFPKWPVANDYSSIMVGDPADAMIASAYAFGADNFDQQEALKHVLKGATEPGATSSGYVERPELKQYMKKGFVSNPATTLEYTAADFSIAQYAQSLGDNDTYQTFMKRAQNWQKLYNPINGLIQPKHANGAFVQNFSPKNKSSYIEGNAYQYVWMVPYNLQGLFNAMGGNEKAVDRLDHFFTELNTGEDGTEYAYLGNEPGLGVPWEYNFAGAPWRTQSVVRQAITELYDSTPAGLPGNDDLGEMSSWYVWSSMGLYPEIPGVGGLTIGSPLFEDIKIHLADGHQLHIVAPEASTDTPYVQKLKMNGEDYDSTWLPLDKVMTGSGGNLHFSLGDKPNKNWASDPEDASPSFSKGQKPAMGYVSKPEISVKNPGESPTLKLGVQNMTSKSMEVDWKASIPDGFELSPGSGKFTVDALGSKTTNLKVKIPKNIADGIYEIPILLSANSKSLTPVTLQIVVAYGDVTGEIESIQADDDNPPDEIVSNLIDGSIGTKWLSFKNTAEITMKLSKPEAVTEYSLTSANDYPGRDPKDWAFYGSKDGRNWSKLDTQGGINFDRRFQRKVFQFKNDEKYSYYRLDITKNAGEDDTQLTGISLSIGNIGDEDNTAPEVKVKMNGKPFDNEATVQDSKAVKFTWDAKDEESGIDKVTANFDGEPYKEGTTVDLAGKIGKHELVVTAVDKVGNVKKKKCVIHVTTSTEAMKQLVKRYKNEGKITDQAAHALNLQLITVGIFEQKGSADKVVKHLKGLEVLLDHQKKNELISDKAYHALKADADDLLKKWEHR